ncbi:MAG: 16S rRNA processing protein RimM [Hyphomicrobiales bacterium]|nr:MAG: 16S rRNA processing protein RimM [Hyphomicrobiales bacterium]
MGLAVTDTRLLLGQLGAAHGVRGEVRLKSFTEPGEAIADYGPFTLPDGRSIDILSLRPVKGGMFVARLSGINDRNAAEALTNAELAVDRDQLPEPDEDEFYHADLIGLTAVGEDGTVLGTIIAVPDFGAGDLVEISPPQGPSVYLPFTRDVVPDIDLANGRAVVRPPEGTFGGEDDDEPAAEEAGEAS